MAIIIFKITTLGKFTVIFQKPFNDFLHIFCVFSLTPAHLLSLTELLKKMEIYILNIQT